jgi:hypothetical protein
VLAPVVVAAIAGFSTAVQAHHSFAIYNSAEPVSLTGIVEAFRWTNPHSYTVLRVRNEDGSDDLWELEQGPVNMLSRQGWTPTTLEPGDRISVVSHLLHSGEPGGRFISFEFIDGPAADLDGPGTILRMERPDPVAMSDAVARDFNGIWVNASGGIHFDAEGSRSRRGQMPPLNDEYMAQWQKRWADADAGLATTDPTASCLPPGFPRFLTMVLPGEILQTDAQLNWYAEFGEATVRIHLDGREPPADLYPSYNGFSTGRWDGNTLTTRTLGLRGDTLVDTTGVPHSDQLEVAMRLRKVTPDYFEAEVTLEDPIAFYEPWSTARRYVRAPAGSSVQEYACEAGNRVRATAEGTTEIVFESP